MPPPSIETAELETSAGDLTVERSLCIFKRTLFCASRCFNPQSPEDIVPQRDRVIEVARLIVVRIEAGPGMLTELFSCSGSFALSQRFRALVT